ncbi:ATP-binding protein [Streptomyces sp. SID3343]|uniref:ATP-binding protein n=1 Tax=Streptomyces sp. SID3343 TaxID=2690260 RepID=UPI00136B9C11|nr:ATP-binding protein [Streptomyces sp. SID3343]MYW04549.1 ATP-binding protein [Streptomyces sp. SID3343]
MKPETSPAELFPVAADFVRRFASTTFGARAARLGAVEQLGTWGWPRDTDSSRTVALIVAELAANAVTHGGSSVYGFELRLTIGSARRGTATVRVEVSDRQGGVPSADATPPGEDGENGETGETGEPDDGGDLAESGRGLILVDALVTGRGVERWLPTGKTVWATLDLPVPTGVVSR